MILPGDPRGGSLQGGPGWIARLAVLPRRQAGFYVRRCPVGMAWLLGWPRPVVLDFICGSMEPFFGLGDPLLCDFVLFSAHNLIKKWS